MRKARNRWPWILGLGAVLILAVWVVAVRWGRGSEGPIDLAAASPHWTFRLTNEVPTDFEALFRVRGAIRIVRGTTPAEFRLGSRGVVAQFRPLDPTGQVHLFCVSAGKGSGSSTFSPQAGATNSALTFLSTHGRLGIPGVGAWGLTQYPWGGREHFDRPWSLWPKSVVVTSAMLDALPAAESWPAPVDAAPVSAAEDPEPPRSTR